MSKDDLKLFREVLSTEVYKKKRFIDHLEDHFDLYGSTLSVLAYNQYNDLQRLLESFDLLFPRIYDED